MTNIYDDQQFFDQYKEMPRSKNGLQGAGEWPTLATIFPNLHEQTVLDLGCGYGWHCRYAASQGAKKIIGVDLSEKMLEEASARTNDTTISYMQDDISTIRFAKDSFDFVFSSLAIHYVENWEQLVQHVHHFLKPNGQFLFSVEHPIFTADGRQDWIYTDNGQIMHFPVDHYFDEGERDTNFLGSSVKKYHRTITTYLETLLSNGFQINHVLEPMPPSHMLDMPGMKDELRRPMMLIISVTKR
ncbi:class I SAM-dependent methyltransferase [Enterococcus mundtii]|uniref:class I SAM-dependent methyltransferase n=1 Tax=Enterococcus mundtii TaxID=53346 RepID=UPI000D361757|nr:class I SAM-dependent methyltransferase [Enterococcus mundtii]NBA60776.1 methyltransferase domain-containing protein [Enterococcus mundtii]PTO37657.1 SAM-dependent methyltransferase [Enterococcus mundtii]PTO44732.1 SAM-dependent methyltransferase [Enterococcus mundtii]